MNHAREIIQPTRTKISHRTSRSLLGPHAALKGAKSDLVSTPIEADSAGLIARQVTKSMTSRFKAREPRLAEAVFSFSPQFSQLF